MPTYQSCLNCGSIWSLGSSEWEWQQCSACGWRPGMPIDDEFTDDDDFDNDDVFDESDANAWAKNNLR